MRPGLYLPAFRFGIQTAESNSRRNPAGRFGAGAVGGEMSGFGCGIVSLGVSVFYLVASCYFRFYTVHSGGQRTGRFESFFFYTVFAV